MRELLRLGMDIARLNFSHGTHEDHAHNIQRLRRAARAKDARSASCRIFKARRFAPDHLESTSPFC